MQANGQSAVSLLLDELVRARVPDLDGAGAVLPLRNLALERRVLERMILYVDREPLLAGLERNALRDGPRCERPVALEPEVVVQPPGVVALDDERRLLTPLLAAERLGRLLRIALAAVLAELRHLRGIGEIGNEVRGLGVYGQEDGFGRVRTAKDALVSIHGIMERRVEFRRRDRYEYLPDDAAILRGE